MEAQSKIAGQKKEYNLLAEKYKKINIVNDQISGWAKRVHSKFGALTDDPVLQRMPDDMVKVFDAMENITVSENASCHGYRFAHQCLGLFEAPCVKKTPGVVAGCSKGVFIFYAV